MNRFEYTPPELWPNEQVIVKDRNVRLYDGEIRTNFEGGEINITTHRIFWGKPGDFENGQICLAVPIKLITYINEESPGAFSFSKNRKIVLHLNNPAADRNQGPQVISQYSYVKLSFRDGFSRQIPDTILDCINKKNWELAVQSQASTNNKQLPTIKLRSGIGGIEKGLEEKQKAADQSISVAFQDLSKLMTMAKDMVQLSQNISTKIRDKQGDITQDETVRFKSYLLSLGIDDPVTRDAYKSDNQYYENLAKQICDILVVPVEEVGGMMVLTDIYCRVNRARGLELLSPEDVLNACRFMQTLNLPLKLHEFESGVKVLQSVNLNSETVAYATADLLEEKGSLTAEELAQILGISVILAKERLLTSEKFAQSCRDDSIEGLRFYPNLFLTKE